MLSTACEQPSSTSQSAAASGGHGLGPGASSSWVRLEGNHNMGVRHFL